MSVKELGKYLGYSNDHIYKLRDGEFIEDIHFHKKGKLLFDRIEIDKWVVGDQKNTALPSHKIVDVKRRAILGIKNLSKSLYQGINLNNICLF